MWKKIKTDFQRNMQAIKVFIWANWVICKFADWLCEKMSSLSDWAGDCIIGWEIAKKALQIEQEKKRKEDLKKRRFYLESEMNWIDKQLQ